MKELWTNRPWWSGDARDDRSNPDREWPELSRAAPSPAPIGSSIEGRSAGLLARPACHHDGSKLVMQLPGLSLFAAQGGKLRDARHLDLILDLAGLVEPRRAFVKSGDRKFRALNDLVWPEVVRLDRPDMTAPDHVQIGFWIRLRSLLSGNVCVACVGAHGRTGTCLAALMIADAWPAEKAIWNVREKHCARAIETKGQEQYLIRLGDEYAVVNRKGEK